MALQLAWACLTNTPELSHKHQLCRILIWQIWQVNNYHASQGSGSDPWANCIMCAQHMRPLPSLSLSSHAQHAAAYRMAQSQHVYQGLALSQLVTALVSCLDSHIGRSTSALFCS